MSRNTSEAEETLKWLKGLDGVANVRMGIMEEFLLADDCFDAEIERHLSAPS